MMNTIIVVLAALLVGILVLVAYRLGIRDGQSVSKDLPIQPLFSTAPEKKEKSEIEQMLDWAEQYEG